MSSAAFPTAPHRWPQPLPAAGAARALDRRARRAALRGGQPAADARRRARRQPAGASVHARLTAHRSADAARRQRGLSLPQRVDAGDRSRQAAGPGVAPRRRLHHRIGLEPDLRRRQPVPARRRRAGHRQSSTRHARLSASRRSARRALRGVRQRRHARPRAVARMGARPHRLASAAIPARVTIFGESGGGRKVSTLLGMPKAKGLFHRAIIQSGPGLHMEVRDKRARDGARAVRRARRRDGGSPAS